MIEWSRDNQLPNERCGKPKVSPWNFEVIFQWQFRANLADWNLSFESQRSSRHLSSYLYQILKFYFTKMTHFWHEGFWSFQKLDIFQNDIKVWAHRSSKVKRSVRPWLTLVMNWPRRYWKWPYSLTCWHQMRPEMPF